MNPSSTPAAAIAPSRARGKRAVAFGAIAVVLALLAGLLPVTAASARDEPTGRSLVVTTSEGKVRGVKATDAQKFLGIPFATPPVGALRLAPPVAPQSWKGVRSADRLSAACMQGGAPASGQAVSEDCLYLDVYRPLPYPKDATLPVIVYIHGGGFGSGSGGLFDGAEMAAATGSIVVTVNYRLGALGFMAVDEMGPTAGNFGLLDQVAALKWVERNIAEFGGDPDVVTVSGQSAGAMSICGLLTSPLTEGLFDRAVLQSGPCTFPAFATRSTAIQRGAAAASALGCAVPAQRMDCLRALDAATIASASGRWTPNSGTPEFPESPATAIAAGNWHKVPLIVGSTRYEGKQGIFFSVGPNAGSMTVAEYEAKVRQFYGPNADAILAQYPAADYEKPAYALAAIDTDSGFGCRSYEFASQVASQAPVYEYEFADPTSPTVKGLRIAGLDMSSAHTAELAYLYTYAEVERPLQGGEVQLAARMKQYWGDFARAGQLSEPWLPVTADDHPVLRLQASGDVIISTFADEHKCGFWATVR